MNNRIDGIIFERMLKSALNNLINHEKEINDMNVFPVADGDTGSNMRLTLENGVKVSKTNKHLGLYLKDVSKGMLLGARGNSGVILSQLFKGIATELARCSIADPFEIRASFIRAYNMAYDAVVHPVEGTILTVAREGIENIKKQIYFKMPVGRVFELYLAEMRKSLEETPNKLPVLKEANVLDSGAYGYVCVIEGMTKALYGEDIKVEEEFLNELDENDHFELKDAKSSAFFNEDSSFEDGYCLEFILQLLNVKGYKMTFKLESFKEILKQYGTSIVCIQDGSIVKVHIHTKTPARVMSMAQIYGEFVSLKLDNLQLQHNEYDEKKNSLIEGDLVSVAIIDGEGIEDLYKDLNCQDLIQAGLSLNVSCDRLLKEFKRIKAKNIVILPNDKNNYFTCAQAKQMSGLDNITILETKSQIEGYYALAFDNPDEEDALKRIEMMKDGIEGITTVSISLASKDYNSEDFSCAKGDIISSIDGVLVKKCDNILTCLKETLSYIDEERFKLADKDAILVLVGKDVEEGFIELLNEFFEKEYVDLEVNIIMGGQKASKILLGIM